jgi:hypothetical protein
VRGEALTGERAGQPLSHEIFLTQDADVVTYAEGETNGCDNASAGTVLRGWRPWPARTLFAWEPGDLQLGHVQLRGGPLGRRGAVADDERTGEVRPFHSGCEAGEQDRTIGRGVGVAKGRDQGKHA